MREPYHEAQIKIFLLLIALLIVGIWLTPERSRPEWWYTETGGLVGLALFGGAFWLSGVIDRWLRG